ncbi:hypothetical protein ABZV75_35050 [Streptomyces flaveolus]|uniref:hypothetical protein n=1 Tax=Streptomyces flaveolus TaxID=67297 RepID=UPI0033A594EE
MNSPDLVPRGPLHGAALLLADAYPGRHVLGLGFGGDPPAGGQAAGGHVRVPGRAGHPGDAETPSPRTPGRRLLAAYGPKMLQLARDRAAGAHTYHVHTAHTAQAREILGPDAFPAVEHAVLFETDPVRARGLAREHLRGYLRTPYNLAEFRRLGYTDDDLSGGGSHRFVDDLVFWGGTRTPSYGSCAATSTRAPITWPCR